MTLHIWLLTFTVRFDYVGLEYPRFDYSGVPVFLSTMFVDFQVWWYQAWSIARYNQCRNHACQCKRNRRVCACKRDLGLPVHTDISAHACTNIHENCHDKADGQAEDRWQREIQVQWCKDTSQSRVYSSVCERRRLEKNIDGENRQQDRHTLSNTNFSISELEPSAAGQSDVVKYKCFKKWARMLLRARVSKDCSYPT